MTLRRAALYIGGASLLVAWFSSAASLSLSRNRGGATVQSEPPPSTVEDLAAQIEHHSKRLRGRLAHASIPQPPTRNPFRFREPPPPPRVDPPLRVVATTMTPVQPSEPTLQLIGLAEHARPEGRVRTALLVTDGDQVITVKVGDQLLQRYTVTAVGVDAVELADLSSGRTRRLALDAP